MLNNANAGISFHKRPDGLFNLTFVGITITEVTGCVLTVLHGSQNPVRAKRIEKQIEMESKPPIRFGKKIKNWKKGPRTPVTKNDLLAEQFFREVTAAGDAGVSAEDLAKTLKLSGPRGFKAVFACLNRVYAADHPMRTKQFPAIKRETKEGKVRYVYRPDAEQALTS